MRRPFMAIFLLAVLCSVAAPAIAWGVLGHRLIAALAWDELTPATRIAIARLLVAEPEPTLPGIAAWADQLRGNDPGLGRRSARWHYVNIAEHGCRFEAARACRGEACVVAAIDRQASILGDRSRSDAERLQALKFVVHLVGDAHQPLHAGFAHDRGGNTVQIHRAGRGGNLHSLWDSGLLYSGGRSETAHLARLRVKPARGRHLPRDAAAAVESSCRIMTRPGFYPRTAKIDDGYLRAWRPVADAQLRLAGSDLAARLNAAMSH